MPRYLRTLFAVVLLCGACLGCGEPTKGVNKDKDRPVPADDSGKEK